MGIKKSFTRISLSDAPVYISALI